MTDRELMQQALEALERCFATCFHAYAHEQVMSRPEHFMNQAITALRERLAQPEQDEMLQVAEALRRVGLTLVRTTKGFDVMNLGQIEAQGAAQPEQEPVAWGYRDRHGNIIDVITPEEHARAEGDYKVPLYATPPRVPQQALTDVTQPTASTEPVAHLWQHSETGRTRIVMPDQIITADATWHVVGPLYLTPPRREWQGLTDEDIDEAHDTTMSFHGFARAIEAKLKEKNA